MHGTVHQWKANELINNPLDKMKKSFHVIEGTTGQAHQLVCYLPLQCYWGQDDGTHIACETRLLCDFQHLRKTYSLPVLELIEMTMSSKLL